MDTNIKIVTDWKIFQSVLFHFIQNAVKYNLEKGQININMQL